MRNYIQLGDMITVPAPVALASGEGVQIGALFGVASTDASQGQNVALGASGVYELPKEATQDTYSVGDAVQWDEAAKTVTALTDGEKIGVVTQDAGATIATVQVRLG